MRRLMQVRARRNFNDREVAFFLLDIILKKQPIWSIGNNREKLYDFKQLPITLGP